MADLKTMGEIIKAGKDAGDNYTEGIEGIHTKITDGKAEGSAIGEMVGASLELTEKQIAYDTTQGVAKAAANQVKAGAGEIKKAGG